MLRQREIVLIPVPFTDLRSQKRRPVLIISNDHYNKNHQDIVAMAITSHITPTDYGVLLESKDLETGALPRPSLIRVDKIYTLSQAIVVKVYGRVKPTVLARVRKLLRKLV